MAFYLRQKKMYSSNLTLPYLGFVKRSFHTCSLWVDNIVMSDLPSPCKASYQAFPVNAFRWRIQDERKGETRSEHVTWKALAACDRSNESYWVVLSFGTVNYAVQVGFNFWVCGWNPQVRLFTVPYFSVRSSRSGTLRYGQPPWITVKTKMANRNAKRSISTILRKNRVLWTVYPQRWPFKWKLLSCAFLWYCLLRYTKSF